jgi:hypothetical protein
LLAKSGFDEHCGVVPEAISLWDHSPKGTCSGSPFKANLDVDIGFIYVVEVVQNHITLCLVQSHNLFRHCTINKQRLPASCRMNSNYWVDSLNVFWPGSWVVTVEICMGADINGLLPVNYLTEVGRKLRVRSITASPQSITSEGWNCVIVQVRDACWVFLVNKIGVPSGRASWLTE